MRLAFTQVFRSFFATLVGAVLLPVSSYAFDPIPPKPLQGISDTAQILSLSLSKSLERLLDEHQNLTGETVMILTLKKAPEEESLDAYTIRVFDLWKGSTPKPPSSVVLVFDLEKNRFGWKGGVGFDSLLLDRGADHVGKQIVVPELRHERPDRAILLATRKFFELLESPVFVNGKFDAEIREGGFYETFTPVSVTKRGGNWWIWLAVALVFGGLMGHRILTVEVHYTSEGWHRVSGWENTVAYFRRKFSRAFNKRSPNLKTGGGVSGTY